MRASAPWAFQTAPFAVASLALLFVLGCETPKAQRPAWIGINTMLGYPDFDGAFASAKTTPAERERYFQLVSEMGSPPVRDLVMSWSRVQPAPGAAFDFSLSDEIVMQAQRRGVDLLALCWGTPGWATTRTSSAPAFDFGVPSRDHVEPFRRFVHAFVERYDADGVDDLRGLKRPIRAYEFLQEMEDIPPEEYAYWLRIFHETVKEADAQALVSLGSLASPGLRLPGQAGDDPTWLERLLAAPPLSGERFPCFDAVSFHSFPESYPGRRPFDESLAYIRQTLAGHGLTKPVWLTEFGCNGDAGAEERQAAQLVKWSLRAKAIGIERAYIYCLWDYRWAAPEQPEEHLGLVRTAPESQDPVRKPAFAAVSTMLAELSRRPEVTRRDENIYALSGEGEVVFALWQSEPGAPALEFLTSDWWEVRTLSGRSFKQQGRQLTLTDAPLFARKVQSAFLDESSFMRNPLLGPPDNGEAREKP